MLSWSTEVQQYSGICGHKRRVRAEQMPTRGKFTGVTWRASLLFSKSTGKKTMGMGTYQEMNNTPRLSGQLCDDAWMDEGATVAVRRDLRINRCDPTGVALVGEIDQNASCRRRPPERDWRVLAAQRLMHLGSYSLATPALSHRAEPGRARRGGVLPKYPFDPLSRRMCARLVPGSSWRADGGPGPKARSWDPREAQK